MSKRFSALNGVLCLDKDVGKSSNDALYGVRCFLHFPKAGHGGTLDPFASGLLPILLGEATKFGRYFLDADKSYEVTLRFGSETDTQDATGKVTREALPPQNIDWEALRSAFCGEIEQIPPAYSALKVNGQRAYDLARRGEEVNLKPRKVYIHRLEVLNTTPEEALLAVTCSKGTYIRTLVQDIGRYLNSAAHAVSLRRTAAGELTLAQAKTLTEIKNLGQEALLEQVIPLEQCLRHLPRLNIPAAQYRFIRNGNDIATQEALPEDAEVMLLFEEQFLGIGRYRSGRIFPERMIAAPNES